jgi:hypothetical protein
MTRTGSDWESMGQVVPAELAVGVAPVPPDLRRRKTGRMA